MMDKQVENPFRKFWDLGYRSLIPVVPPNAEIAPKSNLSESSRGKSPGRVGRDGMWYGANMHNIVADESDLDHWFGWGAGVGMRGGDDLFFVDVDHMDPAASKRLYKLAKEHLGASWPRVGRAPKFALPYRSTSLVRSVAVKFDCDPVEGSEPGLDIISTTPHCVVSGIHATTGQPYEWPKGIPAYKDLTEVTPEQVEAFLRAVCDEFPARSRSVVTSREVPESQESLRGDVSALRNAMRDMPNSNEHFKYRDQYIHMGIALKAAFGPEEEDEARALYLQWCGRWDGGVNDENKAEADWARMKPPFSIGADYIYSKAELLTDFTRPAEAAKALGEQFFEPQEMEGDAVAEPKTHDRFQLRTIDDVFNMPEPKFLIDRHLPETGFGILFGDPGCGKSFLALDMALTLAYGLDDWHGDPVNAQSRGGVLYIAGEGSSGFRSRIKAWQHERLTPEAGRRKPNFHMLFEPINFMRPEDIKHLAEAVRNAGLTNLSLIVVDTVSRSIPGADENLQKDMTIFVHACDALKAATGAFVMGVHHTSKAGEMRGSSVLLGQADVVLRLTRKKGAIVGRLTCDKQKDAPDGWSEAYRFDTITTIEGASSLVPTRTAEAGQGENGAVPQSLQKAILDAMRDAWAAQEPWGASPQSKRYASRIIVKEFGLRSEEASALVGFWEQQGLVQTEVWDARNKRKGYKVVGDLEDADILSDSGGVFE